MVTIYGIHPQHGGSSMYQRAAEGESFPGLDSLDEWVQYVLSENPNLELVEEGDPDYEVVEDTDGRIAYQCDGVVVGWRDLHGDIWLELVYVSEPKDGQAGSEEEDHVA